MIEAGTALSIGGALGLTVATEVAAWRMGFHPALGHGLLHLGQIPIYAPWSILDWVQWRSQVPGIDFGIWAGIVVTGGVVASWLAGVNKKPPEFGKDAWGTKAEAAAAEILAPRPRGTILGAWSGNRLLSYNGDEHQLVSGAAGSGKTTSSVLPTLLTWRESILVYDPKRELYAQSAAWRQTLGEAFYFDPTCPDSACFNPMLEVRVGTQHETGDVQNLVSILVDPGGSKNALEYWDSDAAKLLTALVLHALHDLPAEQHTLAHVNEMLLGIAKTLPAMMKSAHEKCRQIASYIAALPEKQRAGVYGSASSSLILYDDPLVAEKTSRSDFRISDLVCSPCPMTCYLQVRPTDAVRLRPLTRLILTQVAQALMYDIGKASDGRAKKHRLLYLLEEFPSLGRLDFFSSQMRVMRGYGITAMLIVQSFKDIINAYGRDQTIVDNCRIVVAFAASDPDTLRMISAMVGSAVELKESMSRPRALGGWFKATTNVSEQRRPLLDPGEVRMLAYDEQIVLVTGAKPFRTKKAQWFEHPALRKLGTNLRKDGIAPGQNAEILKMHRGQAFAETTDAILDRPARDEVVATRSDILNWLQSLIVCGDWSLREAAPVLFPGITERGAVMWINGERAKPTATEQISARAGA